MKLTVTEAIDHALLAEMEGSRVFINPLGGQRFDSVYRGKAAKLAREPRTLSQIAEDLRPELESEPGRTRLGLFLGELEHLKNGARYSILSRKHRLPRNLIEDIVVASLGYAVWKESSGRTLTDRGRGRGRGLADAAVASDEDH